MDEPQSDRDFREIMSLSFDTMQNTIARVKLAAYRPDYTVIIPRSYQKAGVALKSLIENSDQRESDFIYDTTLTIPNKEK